MISRTLIIGAACLFPLTASAFDMGTRSQTLFMNKGPDGVYRLIDGASSSNGLMTKTGTELTVPSKSGNLPALYKPARARQLVKWGSRAASVAGLALGGPWITAGSILLTGASFLLDETADESSSSESTSSCNSKFETGLTKPDGTSGIRVTYVIPCVETFSNGHWRKIVQGEVPCDGASQCRDEQGRFLTDGGMRAPRGQYEQVPTHSIRCDNACDLLDTRTKPEIEEILYDTPDEIVPPTDDASIEEAFDMVPGRITELGVTEEDEAIVGVPGTFEGNVPQPSRVSDPATIDRVNTELEKIRQTGRNVPDVEPWLDTETGYAEPSSDPTGGSTGGTTGGDTGSGTTNPPPQGPVCGGPGLPPCNVTGEIDQSWFDLPDLPEMPTTSLDIWTLDPGESWLPNECPDPVEIPVNVLDIESYEMDFAPACPMLGTLGFLFQAAAFLGATLIVIRGVTT